MKKLITLLAILHFWLISSAQNKEISDFINQVYPQFLPSNFEYYNLAELSLNAKPDLRDYGYELSLKYPDFSINEFSDDSLIINWNDYKLVRTKTYSADSITNNFLWKKNIKTCRFTSLKSAKKQAKVNVSSSNEVQLTVPVKHWWIKKHFASKKHLFKTGKIEWDNYINQIKKENQTLFFISKPVFSKNKEYAVIVIQAHHLHPSENYRYTYLYKKESNTWNEIAEIPSRLAWGTALKIIRD